MSAQNGTELGTDLSANSVFERTVVGVTSTANTGYLVNVPGT